MKYQPTEYNGEADREVSVMVHSLARRLFVSMGLCIGRCLHHYGQMSHLSINIDRQQVITHPQKEVNHGRTAVKAI
jgi:hypothetical protein